MNGIRKTDSRRGLHIVGANSDPGQYFAREGDTLAFERRAVEDA